MVAVVALVALLAAVAVPAAVFVTRDEPQRFENALEHFKYGSVGTEELQGVPFEIWAVLPDVFEDLLPRGAGGEGYERLGFLYEPGQERPVGMSYREKPVGLVGVNCALCHTGTYRERPGGPREVVYGMPANRFRLGDYITFLRRVSRDDRFDADTLLPAIERRFPGRLNVAERALYRYLVIPETKKGLEELDDDFTWLDSRPAFGPGRVDTFNPWKERFDFDMAADKTVGTADFPSIWNQRAREDVALHWDGNNPSLLERNISASMAVGATKDSLDVDELNRAGEWLLDLKPPRMPARYVDERLAARGAQIYGQQCASCHALGGKQVGKVTRIEDLGTDPERMNSFSAALVEEMNTLGEGKPWAFHNFRKTNGYANLLLDGLWLRAPYLHNGSVPTLRALLFPEERPRVFYTGYDVYDFEDVGFVSSGAAARREGFRFDTTLPGNSNRGHLYGTELPPESREALLEFLKTL